MPGEQGAIQAGSSPGLRDPVYLQICVGLSPRAASAGLIQMPCVLYSLALFEGRQVSTSGFQKLLNPGATTGRDTGSSSGGGHC